AIARVPRSETVESELELDAFPCAEDDELGSVGRGAGAAGLDFLLDDLVRVHRIVMEDRALADPRLDGQIDGGGRRRVTPAALRRVLGVGVLAVRDQEVRPL